MDHNYIGNFGLFIIIVVIILIVGAIVGIVFWVRGGESNWKNNFDVATWEETDDYVKYAFYNDTDNGRFDQPKTLVIESIVLRVKSADKGRFKFTYQVNSDPIPHYTHAVVTIFEEVIEQQEHCAVKSFKIKKVNFRVVEDAPSAQNTAAHQVRCLLTTAKGC